jgi:hypothetical protein
MIVVGNACYGIYYLLMFAVPLVVGSRFSHRAQWLLRLGCICGIVVTLLSIIFAFVPIVEVKSPMVFAAKVGLAIFVTNLAGAAVYLRGKRLARTEPHAP